jgi:hypothetical protein
MPALHRVCLLRNPARALNIRSRRSVRQLACMGSIRTAAIRVAPRSWRGATVAEVDVTVTMPGDAREDLKRATQLRAGAAEASRRAADGIAPPRELSARRCLR